ncbi:MAG TPA: hypothetical protein VKU92_07145 [Acidimicrobiales bacterium]|nr:hypothetical protein [Acidimicrobiales bacterium]
MIVRILGEGQYELPETAMTRLDALDHALEQAIEASDEAAASSALAAIIAEVRSSGTAVHAATLIPSDLTVPHEGSTIAEIEQLLASESAPDPATSVTEGA